MIELLGNLIALAINVKVLLIALACVAVFQKAQLAVAVPSFLAASWVFYDRLQAAPRLGIADPNWINFLIDFVSVAVISGVLFGAKRIVWGAKRAV